MIEDLANANRIIFENNQVRSIQLDLDSRTFQYGLLLKLASDESQKASQVILFYDVQRLEIHEFGGGLVQFMNLHITESELGYDRARLHVEDREHGLIKFDCSSFELLC